MTPGQWRTTQRKKRRSKSDPFKDSEYYELLKLAADTGSKQKGTLDNLLAQKDAERELTKQAGNWDEVKKRGREFEAIKEYRRTVNQLKNAKLAEKQTAYALQQGFVPAEETENAKSHQTMMSDTVKTLREYVEDYRKKAELMPQLPVPSKGTAAPNVLQELAQVTKNIMRKDMQMALVSDLYKKGQLITREDIKKSFLAKGIENNLKDRAQMVSRAAQIAGAKTPEEVKTFLGGKPEEFNAPRSVLGNLWHYGVGTPFNVLQSVGSEIGGLLKGITSAGLEPGAGIPEFEKASQWTKKYRPVQDPFGLSQKMNLPRQLAAGVEGAARALPEPWQGKWSTLDWMKQIGEAPGLGWAKNKYGGPIAAALLEMGTDPLNLVAFPGTLTSKGMNIKSVYSATRQAMNYAKRGEKAQAFKQLTNAVDLAKSAGLIKSMPKGNLTQKINELSKIAPATSLPGRIKSGESVLLGLRSGGKGREALQLPETMRKIEAGISQPFSSALDILKAQGATKSFAKAFGAKSLMTPALKQAHETTQIQRRAATGGLMEVAKEAAPAFRNLSPEGGIKVLRAAAGYVPASQLDDAERAALDVFNDVMGKSIMASGRRGLATHRRFGYVPGEYIGSAGKKTLRGALKPAGEGRKPLRTFTMTSYNDDVIQALKEADPQAIIKETRGGLKVTGRFEAPFGKDTPIPFETPTRAPMWTTKEKQITDPLEAIKQYGPTYQTDPFQVMMNRVALSEAGRSTEAWKDIMASQFGLTKGRAEELGTTVKDLKKTGQYQPFEGGVKTGRLLSEPQPYYSDKELFNVLKAFEPGAKSSGVNKLLKDKEMSGFLAKQFGVKPVGEQFAKSTTKHPWVPKDITGYLESQLPATHGRAFNTPMRAFDKLTNMWKATATAWNPGFHGRNFLSNLWQMRLANVNVLDPTLHRDAIKVMSGKGAEGIVKVAGKNYTVHELKKMAENLDVLTGGIHGENIQDMKRLLETAGTPLRKRALTSLKKSYAPWSTEFPLTTGGRAVGRGIENEARMVMWMDRFRKTGNPVMAAEDVQKFLFDYGDLARFEKAKMRRAVPFWAWTRKNIPLQFEMMAREPQKYAHLLKLQKAAREGGLETWGKEKIQGMESFMPPYMRDMLASLTPMTYKDKPLYFNPNLPFQDITKADDLLKIFNPEESQDVLFNINPLLKIPAGLALGSKTQGLDIPEGTKPTAPWLAKGVNALYTMLGQGEKAPAFVGESEYTHKPTWYAPGKMTWALSQIPFLQNLITMTRTDRDDQMWQRLSRLGGVKFIPFDWQKEYERKGGEKKSQMLDLMDEMKKRFDVEVPEYKNPKLIAPPAASTLWKYMLDKEIPMNEVGRQYALFKYSSDRGAKYAPLPMPSLEDLMMMHFARVKIPLPKYDKRTGTWYVPSQKRTSVQEWKP